MIIVTGAAGFIGSCLVSALNKAGRNDLVLVDDFSIRGKKPNLEGKQFLQLVHRDEFNNWLDINKGSIDFIFHMGARTDTTEKDRSLLWRLNTDYSKMIWQHCVRANIPLVYASSAATYGGGELGYDDQIPPKLLKPLNPYGESKNVFDDWVLNQKHHPSFWAGLKFFNVYGPNEYHKGRMASVVFHAYNQIIKQGYVNLFRSHKAGIDDGMQLRDFIYIEDVLTILLYFMKARPANGLYNVGTGKAESFLHLVQSIFKALDQKPDIRFVDTPTDIRDTYQYFTEAKLDKLHSTGFHQKFHSLEKGVATYVKDFLQTGEYR